jgi:hypothetical protein
MRKTIFVPLPLAAAELGLSWAQAYHAVLTGRLQGERRGARWVVSVDSVRNYRTQTQQREETSVRPRTRGRGQVPKLR